MRQTVVPAQITTVEDKIVGNLSIQQLGLLLAPLLLGIVFFVMLPPFLTLDAYKLGLVAVLAVLCGSLAIRWEEKIVFFWLLLMIAYKLRPRYHVYDRTDIYLRRSARQADILPEAAYQETNVPVKQEVAVPQVTAADALKITELMNNPQAEMRFVKNRKGELRVVLKEVK